VSLTVGGFAPARTLPLHGKGGNRGRRDNEVSPPPPVQRVRNASAKGLPAALEWRDVSVPIVGRLWATAWLPSVLLAGCLVALMYLLQTSSITTTGYDIQRLQQERDDWQLRNEQLRLELAKRRSLTWIEAEATARLGMVQAEPTALTYIHLSP
jgi:hypothetical protein